MFPVPLDPLEKVPSLTELHHNEQLPCLCDRHCVQDLDNMTVVDLSLDLDLGGKGGKHKEIFIELYSIFLNLCIAKKHKAKCVVCPDAIRWPVNMPHGFIYMELLYCFEVMKPLKVVITTLNA